MHRTRRCLQKEAPIFFIINDFCGYAISRARQNGRIAQLGHHLREMLKARYFTNTHLPQIPFLLNPTLYPLQQRYQSSIKFLFIEESLKNVRFIKLAALLITLAGLYVNLAVLEFLQRKSMYTFSQWVTST